MLTRPIHPARRIRPVDLLGRHGQHFPGRIPVSRIVRIASATRSETWGSVASTISSATGPIGSFSRAAVRFFWSPATVLSPIAISGGINSSEAHQVKHRLITAVDLLIEYRVHPHLIRSSRTCLIFFGPNSRWQLGEPFHQGTQKNANRERFAGL